MVIKLGPSLSNERRRERRALPHQFSRFIPIFSKTCVK
jgi:hypothetical protein